MKKNVICILLSTVIISAGIMGCASNTSVEDTSVANEAEEKKEVDTTENEKEEENEKDVILEWETTATAERIPELQAIVDEFTAKTGIEVELVTPGNDYETVMKTRMASGDLPDVWETHGWSVARYSEYLMPLNEEAWYGRIDESILPVISDDDKKIYTLPLTIGVNTITYNKAVFEKAGVDAAQIRTWDDFNEACAKIAAIGVTPIFCGNKDSSTIAQLCENIPPAFLTTSAVKDNQTDALKDGSFDWAVRFTPIAELVNEWMENNYFNQDILTSDNDAGCQALAAGECGMMFGGGNNILFARTYNPEVELGYLACPAADDAGKSFLSMGEGTCVGIWKDGEHPEESRAFLEYLASEEVCTRIATVSGDIPGLKDVKNEGAYVTKAFRETCAAFEGDIEYVPLFDREYLPSGMWDDLGVGMTKIIMNPGKGVKECVSYLQEAYTNKMDQ